MTPQLETLLSAAPDRESWLLLTEHLEEGDDLDAVDRALATWPDALRRAPKSWAATLVSSAPDPRLRITREVSFEDVYNLRLAPDNVAAFAANLIGLSLTSLDLGVQIGLGARGVAALCKALPIDTLERLNLYACFDEGITAVRAIAGCARLSRLQRLDLRSCKITDKGLALLAGSEHLANLRYIDVDGYNAPRKKRITHVGIAALASSPHMAKLEALHARFCDFDHRAFDAIISSPYLHKLRALDVGSYYMSVDELERFLASPVSQHLERFSLSGDPGVVERVLAEPRFTELEHTWSGFAPPEPPVEDEEPEPETTSEVIVALRDLLVEAPDARRWRDLMSFFSDLEDGDLQLAVDYAVAHLEGWPDAIRRAPMQWAETMPSDAPNPRLALARHIEWGEGLDGDAAERFDAHFEGFGFTTLTWWGDMATPHRLFLKNTRLPGLRTLEMGNGGKSTVAKALVASACRLEIESLTLNCVGASEATLRTLFAPGTFPALTHLAARMYPGGATLANVLAVSVGTDRLRSLDVSYGGLDDSSVRLLVTAPHLASLERLLLRGSNDSLEASVQALSTPGLLPRLTHLDLSNASFAESAFARVSDAGAWRGLKALILHQVRCFEGTLRGLSGLPPSLTHLDLYGTGLTGDDLEALAGASFWSGLQTLYLGSNKIEGELPSLALPALRVLGLDHCRLEDRALGSLLGLELPRLEELDLKYNAISPAALARLAGEARWPNLRKLAVDDVEDATLDAILGAFSHLEQLDVGLEQLGVRSLKTVIDDPRFHPHLASYARDVLASR